VNGDLVAEPLPRGGARERDWRTGGGVGEEEAIAVGDWYWGTSDVRSRTREDHDQRLEY